MTEPSHPERILVLDGVSRAAVEAVQSLGKRGFEVHVAGSSGCPAFASRWATRKLSQPSTSDSQRFTDWVRALPDAYALIVPATGYSLHHLARLPESDPLRARAVLPPPDALRIALDKSLTLDAATRLGVGVPSSAKLTGRDAAAAAEGPFPRVLKPVHSVIEQGDDLSELAPILVRDPAQRKEALEQLLPQCPVLEQELVPGIGIGVECLYAEGKLVRHFAHERLHEGTGSGLGSGSFYRKSIEPPAELLRAATALLDDLRWHGVAMVEFKYEPASGRSWLMEINPRLWGSVALAIDAGVDFPYGLYCVATGRELGPQPTYRRPYYTRLVPHDLGWIGRQVRRSGLARSLELVSFLRVLTGRESWDHFAWRDPGPLIRVGASFLRERRGVRANRRQARMDSNAALRCHAANMPRLASRGSAGGILFVCTGNICRSSLAAALWNARYPAMKASSAGFIKREGRPAPDNVRAIARARGISLEEHSSRVLTEPMLRDSDVVVLFEPRHFVALSHGFPQYLDKVVMLGAMLQPPRPSIDDPYQRSVAETEQIGAQVDAGLDELARFLGLSLRARDEEPAPEPAHPSPGWSPSR